MVSTRLNHTHHKSKMAEEDKKGEEKLAELMSSLLLRTIVLWLLGETQILKVGKNLQDH